MGIILLHSIEHFNFYSFPEKVPFEWMNFTDQAIWRGLFFTFSNKAYAVFALLFGFSFYIQDNNFEVTESKIYSIFDYLYKQYTEERRVYLQKHKKVSEYDSENLMYSLIEDIISANKYSSLDVVCHFPLNMLIKNPELLNEQECQYAMNPATHLDFLIYNRIGKKPVLAIEVDGYEYHKEDTVQASRDLLKNHIMELYEIPLLRFMTKNMER